VLQPLYTILEGTLNNAFYNPVHAPFLEACLYTRQFQFGRSTLSWVYIAAYEVSLVCLNPPDDREPRMSTSSPSTTMLVLWLRFSATLSAQLRSSAL
jgi:hypothetical protein